MHSHHRLFVIMLAVLSGMFWAPRESHGVIWGLRGAPSGASSEFNASFVAANAFDSPTNPTAARWASAFVPNDDEFIFVDLGTDVALNTITIDWETASATNYTILTRTEAQGLSLNPADWTVVATRTGAAPEVGGGGQGDDDTFDFKAGVLSLQSPGGTGQVDVIAPVGRYLVINPTSDAGTCCDGYSIWEVKVDANPFGFNAIDDPIVVAASSEFNASFTGDNLFDERIGAADSDWAGVGPGPHSVDLDFSQVEEISGFAYTQRNNVGIPGADNVTLIELFLSNDGVFGLVPDVVITDVAQDLATHFYDLGETYLARFVRFQVTGTQFNPGGAELDFFVAVVPEPGTGLLALFGAAGLMLRRRRAVTSATRAG